MKSIADIIELAGGERAIADATQNGPKPIDPPAVRRWVNRGIPDVHWSVLIRLAGVTIEELYAANRKAPGRQRRRKSCRPRSSAAA